jgi:hypothetical protein
VPATRYEILLPLKYNEGKDVEAEKLLLTKQELIARFGAITVVPHPVQGVWSHEGSTYQDLLLKFVVDVADDDAQSQQFFREFKERLKGRFHQLDVWIVAFPIRLV